MRALAFDPAGLQPGFAARAAVGVTLPVLLGAATGHPTEGVIAAAGALPAGVAGIGGSGSRGALVATTTLGMTVSTFVGGMLAGHVAPTLAVVGAWAFVAGLLAAQGRQATIVGTQAVVALLVFGRFPGSTAAVAFHAGCVMAGGALQGVLVAAVRPPQRYLAERRALAGAYAELARLAHDVSAPGAAAAAAVQAADDLIVRRTGEDSGLLRGLADEAGRIRLELQSLAALPALGDVEDLTHAAAAWLRRLSQGLRSGEPLPEPDDDALPAAVERLRAARAAAPAGPSGTPTRYAAARAAAMLGQLRAADRLTAALAGVRRFTLVHALGPGAVLRLPNRVLAGLRRLLLTARDPLSPAFRHGVRLAVVLPLADGLTHLLPWQRGYWVPLTALVVLKPDYGATVQRGIARVIGTGLGVVLSGLLVVAVHPSGVAVTVLVAGFAWASYTLFAASYALYSFAITGLVVVLIAPTGNNALSTVADRGLDTLIGGATALAAYLVWPTWENRTLDVTLTRLLGGLADYAGLVLGGYVDPARYDRQAVDRAAREVRRARTDAQASLDRALAEPDRVRADTDRAGGLLSATRRIVVSLHALRTTVEDAERSVPLPEVAPVRSAVVAALRALADGRAERVEGLRELQLELSARARADPVTLHARRTAVVAAHLDPLVDSIDTAAHVLAPADGRSTQRASR